MKKIISVLVLVVAAFLFFSYVIYSPHKQNNSGAAKDNGNSVSVLELFTSQGCSSCPPADRLLGKYAGMQNVIALSYHVDYWNRLGWKDPFSSNVFSQRQNNYAGAFKLGSVYTPQLIINGEAEMVGSDEGKIGEAIKKEQAKEVTAILQINEAKSDDNKVSIGYTIRNNENNSVLNVALVQTKVTTSIKAGENGGVELTNYNVVRNFKQIPAAINETNTISIDLVKGVDKKELAIVTFLQNSKTYKIYAAAKSPL